LKTALRNLTPSIKNLPSSELSFCEEKRIKRSGGKIKCNKDNFDKFDKVYYKLIKTISKGR